MRFLVGKVPLYRDKRERAIAHLPAEQREQLEVGLVLQLLYHLLPANEPQNPPSIERGTYETVKA